MAPCHSAKHQRAAWGGIGGCCPGSGAPAAAAGSARRDPASRLTWAARGGRGDRGDRPSSARTQERKQPAAAGGPTGRGGAAAPGRLWPWCCTARRPLRARGPSAPTRGWHGPRCPLLPRVTPAPGRAGGPAGRTSEEPRCPAPARSPGRP